MSLTIPFEPHDWLKNAMVYNKRFTNIPSKWIKENTDVLLLLFNTKGADKDGIVQKFYHIYECIKHANIPIEVIYVPLEETEDEMKASFEIQANWFTLMFDDSLVLELMYMYQITSVPHILVLKPDCTVISYHGIMDLEEYGKNAVITWLSTTACKKERKLNKEADMYGSNWNYLKIGTGDNKSIYRRRFALKS
ncbi:unnamed protein product [Diatraea saccharalis]|uniref:Thioredoxin-like fold domain-containing protein n=1 Tax=Diatraea saccharalis TaxID=40085 RepID=A0A9N9WFG8_9NEOP|nr:unnamed protein product [Diatraea saccharalis]